ncbi:MAG: hypothetical protein ACK5H0_10405 [Bacteroidota bacterium]
MGLGNNLTKGSNIIEYLGIDPDAQAYIAAVEAADGQLLESSVKTALDSFVKGCKSDGIWDAIKASCIIAGARTISGALVPLKGTAPTNFNFVSGDYSRKTGLIGNGTTKYLNSNRANNTDPQNNFHQSVYVNTIQTGTSFRGLIGAGASGAAGSTNITTSTSLIFRNRNPSGLQSIANQHLTTGFKGSSRSISTSYIARSGSSNSTFNVTSASGVTSNITVFRNESQSANSDASLSFYSIGESLDLSLLDSRVTTLISDIATAIP